MSGGRSDTSEQAAPGDHATPTDELAEALDRLTRRISDVAEWAERASIPGAVSVSGEPATPKDNPVETALAESFPADRGQATTFGVIRSFRDDGAVANGVFTAGGDVTQLDPIETRGRVSLAGMLALLDLIPPQTVLEVRTTVSEWRAARLADEAFALELSNDAAAVDEWLATLLSASGD